MSSFDRRRFLAAAGFAGVATLVSALTSSAPAHAGDKKRKISEKIEKIEPTAEGTTFHLALDNAPYPTEGSKYTDDTVLVFVPKHYRLPGSGAVDFVVHFHGHNSTAHGAMTHRLREQLRESRQNAVLVVPQGPVAATDGDFGKLMKKNGLSKLLTEVRTVLASSKPSKELGDASLDGAEKTNRVILSAHSGGYLAAAACVRRAGVEIREVYLFDSLYGEVEAFRAWMVEDPDHHKIVSYHVSEKPRENSEQLAKALTKANVSVVQESGTKRVTREELVKHRAVFLAGRSSHGGADWEEAALRDCLFASCLKGRGSKDWHKEKEKTR